MAQLTEAKVDEFDLDGGIWQIPNEHRKNRRHSMGAHELPLADEAITWVLELMKMADKTGHLYPLRKLRTGMVSRNGKAGRGAFSLWLEQIHNENGA